MKKKALKSMAAAVFILPLVLSDSPFPSESSLLGSHASAHETISPDHSNKHAFELFANPVIGDGADPWVVKHSDGFYYYTQTTGNNITIWKSKTLSGLGAAEKKVVWNPAQDAPNRAHMWAPELHFLDGKWYIYYAASDGDMGKQRMYVLQSEGADPFGPYSHPEGTDYGQIADPSNKWAIDGTVLEYNNRRYFVWSGWEGDVNVSQHLYIAPMKNPWTISGERIEISRPELEWEKIGTPTVNEGPQVLKNKQGKVFIVYSASGSWTDDYTLGMLTLEGTDPLVPEAWVKSQEPVFKKNPYANVYGPGHCSFVKSPDGKEDWILYHAAKFMGAGWNRSVRMQKFSWNKDGTPHFGVPVGADTLLKVPSGESDGKLTPALPGQVYKYEAEDAIVHNAKIVSNTGASGGKKVGYIDFDDSFVEFDVQVPAGDFTLKVRYSNGMGETASHFVTLNGNAIGELSYESFGWDSWKNAELDITLDAQPSKIRFSKGTLFTELDSIELVPIETKVFRYEAEHGQLKEVKVFSHQAASNGQKIELDKRNGQAKYPILAAKSGTYELKVRYANGSGQAAAHQLLVNGNSAKTLDYENNGWDHWQTVSVPVKLKKGENIIGFKTKYGLAQLDCFTLEFKE